MCHNRLLFLLLLTLSVAGCCGLPDHVYQISDDGWSYDEPAIFPALGESDPLVGTLYVGHTDDYGYENLYIKIVQLASVDTLASEVISIPLMHQGAWLGEGCSGDLIVKYPLSLAENVATIHVYQHSREDKLSGVSLVGLE